MRTKPSSEATSRLSTRTSKLLVAALAAAALAPASAAAVSTLVTDAAELPGGHAGAASPAAVTPAAPGAPDQSFCSPVHDEINEWIYHEPHVDSWGPDYTVGWYGRGGNCIDSDVVALLVVSHRGPVSYKHPVTADRRQQSAQTASLDEPPRSCAATRMQVSSRVQAIAAGYDRGDSQPRKRAGRGPL